jgi:ABC-type Zn uptake system ZnuABC Zn-binding protein ZnuA
VKAGFLETFVHQRSANAVAAKTDKQYLVVSTSLNTQKVPGMIEETADNLEVMPPVS